MDPMPMRGSMLVVSSGIATTSSASGSVAAWPRAAAVTVRTTKIVNTAASGLIERSLPDCLSQRRLLEQLDGATRVVGQGEHLVELDLRLHAIALDDPVAPGSAVEGPGVVERLPLVDAAGPAAFAPDEVFADQTLRLPEPGRDRVEVRPARGDVDVSRQLVADGGGDHGASQPVGFGGQASMERRPDLLTNPPGSRTIRARPRGGKPIAYVKGSKSAKVRRQLDHPVIDGDGHWLEPMPIFLDYLNQVGGPSLVEHFKSKDVERGWYAMTREERLDTRPFRPTWWGEPANTLDRATAMVPKLFYERLDDFGVDFCLLYTSLGLFHINNADEQIRRGVSRAVNLMNAEMFAPYRDRIAPAAVIPVYTPEEAIEEATYAVKDLGFKVIMISNHVKRRSFTAYVASSMASSGVYTGTTAAGAMRSLYGANISAFIRFTARETPRRICASALLM